MSDEEDFTPIKPVESELLVVTGMSGAGRTTAAHALEDHGWYVVDNLPPQMLGTLAELVSRMPESMPRLAVVVDVRSQNLFRDIRESLNGLKSSGINYRVIFLDAADNVLVRRFEQGRRPHPLQGDGRISDGITAERELLARLKDAEREIARAKAQQVLAAAGGLTEDDLGCPPAWPGASHSPPRVSTRSPSTIGASDRAPAWPARSTWSQTSRRRPSTCARGCHRPATYDRKNPGSKPEPAKPEGR